jgi:xylulokinase
VLSSSHVAAESIACIGLSGQMHGAVLLDADGAVLRPSIIWCDQRTEAECRWLDETVGRDRLLQLTSNPPLTNFTLTKLLWVRTHEPDIWKHVRQVLLPKDYVRFRLSGEFAIDVADASGTLMLDVAERCWSHDMLDGGRHRREHPAGGVRVSGNLRAGLGGRAASTVSPRARRLSPARETRRPAPSAWASTRPGAVSATIGTSGVVFAATDRPATDPKGRLHTFCHAIPGRCT